MLHVDPATTERYAPILGAAGTTTAMASLGSSFLGATRGSALAALAALAAGALLRRDGRHPSLAFWFLVSGVAAGVFSVAYAPARAVLVSRYRPGGSWSSGPGFSADIGGTRVSFGVRPGGRAIQDAEIVES